MRDRLLSWLDDADQADGIVLDKSTANAGGIVNAVAIVKVQASRDYPGEDLLNDIVVGTAVNQTTGEIVIYLNPYVWVAASQSSSSF